jgi:mannose-1-phosphate guanylyltransferase
MVLAAGLGTRLRPLTDACAKPLVPVGDRPALDHVLDRLRAAGVTRLVVNAHHHARQLVAHANTMRDLAVSVEDDLLGTAGGIERAGPVLGEGDAIVWNGDILAEVDVRDLVAAHRDLATLVVERMERGAGSVGVDGAGRIVRLRQERFGDEVHGGQFLGIQVLSAELRALLPARGGLVEDLYVPALARGATLRAHPFEGAWHDIGSVASYLGANLAWLARRGSASWQGADAHVAETVALERTVVGAGAVVTGAGALDGCVVWPRARARAPLAGQVVIA